MSKAQKRKYSCASCNAGVEKYMRCGPVLNKDGEKTDYAGLHGWRCQGVCHGPIKVKVELYAL